MQRKTVVVLEPKDKTNPNGKWVMFYSLWCDDKLIQNDKTVVTLEQKDHMLEQNGWVIIDSIEVIDDKSVAWTYYKKEHVD